MTISNKFSKKLRRNSTETEKILWHYLRNRKFFGYKFRRQFTIGNYITDFICLEKKLVIELDGSEHLKAETIQYDKKRTEFLNKRGFKVVRFYNNDILNNIDSVLNCLYQELVSPSSGFQPPSPLQGEGFNNTFTPKGEGLEMNDQEPNTFTPKGEGLKNTFTPQNKQQLRIWAKEIRSTLDMEALSKKLVKKLSDTKEYKNAKNIMIFYPLKDEVNLLSLSDDEEKNFYLPKIDGENLLCCRFDKNTELCESCFHTKEPVISPSSGFLPPSPLQGEGFNNTFTPKGEGLEMNDQEPNTFTPPDLVIVPALAVDKKNYRLGYGKGFYDRFLSQLSSDTKTIVCIPKELIVETIFPNEHDIPVDIIITD